MTPVQRLAAFAVGVRRDGLPADLVSDVTARVRDLIGISLAAQGQASVRAVQALVEHQGGRPEAAVIGAAGRYPAANAALVNGSLAHALDYDDTHLPSVLHPSASVVPAALAAAEASGADGATVLAGIAVGIEICTRLGMAGYDRELGNSVFFEHGFHATSICGALGAAAAAGLVGGLDEAGIAHAIGIAASMGAGIIEANRTGGSVKQVHCGWAAHSGVSAAQLTAFGLTGPPTVLEGRFGFLRAFCGERADESAVVGELGTHWELRQVSVKPYPSNHFTHAGIDAALALRADGLKPDDIESVELGLPTAVLRTVAEPADAKANPPTGYAAKFSGPFTFALALRGGGGLGLAIADFTDANAHDPDLRALAARVRCLADETCDRIFPNQLPAIARVRLSDGAIRQVQVLTNRGGHERPLTTDEQRVKFRDSARSVLSDAELDRLDALITALPGATDIGRLLRATTPSTPEEA